LISEYLKFKNSNNFNAKVAAADFQDIFFREDLFNSVSYLEMEVADFCGKISLHQIDFV